MADTIEEYNRMKATTIEALERKGDKLSGVDERIDFLAPRILNALAEIRSLKSSLGLGGMMKRREQIPFSRLLAIPPAVGSGATIQELSTLTGFIKEVTIHWPPGCNALVDVAVGYLNTQFCPRVNFLALDSATPTYYFNEPVTKDKTIWVTMRNRDGGFVHNITVTVTVEEA